MRYRLLRPDEWDRLQALVPEDKIPHPDAAVAAVAEDDEDRLVGVLFLQLTLHMEPLVLQSPKVSFERLHDTLIDAVKGDKGLHIYVFSDKEIIDRMAAHVGMTLLPFKIFEEVVT